MANNIIAIEKLVENISVDAPPYRELIFSQSPKGYSFKILEDQKEVYQSESYKDQEDSIFRGLACLDAFHDSKPLIMDTYKTGHYTAREAVRVAPWRD